MDNLVVNYVLMGNTKDYKAKQVANRVPLDKTVRLVCSKLPETSFARRMDTLLFLLKLIVHKLEIYYN